MAAGATYEPIATQTLGSNATTITFSSIGSGYTDLRLSLVGSVTSVSTQYYLRFNGVSSGFPYSGTYIGGDGSSASSTRYTNSNEIPINGINTGGTTTPHFFLVDVFSYAGSTKKTCLIEISHDRNGSGYVERAVGLWNSTAAITSVTITVNTGNMATGTTATLYGIKNA